MRIDYITRAQFLPLLTYIYHEKYKKKYTLQYVLFCSVKKSGFYCCSSPKSVLRLLIEAFPDLVRTDDLGRALSEVLIILDHREVDPEFSTHSRF